MHTEHIPLVGEHFGADMYGYMCTSTGAHILGSTKKFGAKLSVFPQNELWL